MALAFSENKYDSRQSIMWIVLEDGLESFARGSGSFSNLILVKTKVLNEQNNI